MMGGPKKAGNDDQKKFSSTRTSLFQNITQPYLSRDSIFLADGAIPVSAKRQGVSYGAFPARRHYAVGSYLILLEASCNAESNPRPSHRRTVSTASKQPKT
jgi:hypothetical protein